MKLRKFEFLDFEPKNNLTKKTLLVLLMGVCVYIVYNILTLIFAVIAGVIYAITNAGELSQEAMMQSDFMMLFSLFVTGVGIVIALIYVRFLEKRPLSRIGFTKQDFLKQYGMGYLIGILLISTPVLIMLSFNGKVYFNAYANYSILLLYFLGFLLQGAWEEILFRGFLFTSLKKTTNLFWAISISSILFAVLHMNNPAMNVLPFINLVLFAVFACFFFLRTKNLWAICAIHSAWNFFQGNIFGIEVSGQVMQSSLLNTKSAAPEILSGGDFGLEGGLLVTAVLVAATLITIFVGKNKLVTDSEPVEKNTEEA